MLGKKCFCDKFKKTTYMASGEETLMESFDIIKKCTGFRKNAEITNASICSGCVSMVDEKKFR